MKTLSIVVGMIILVYFSYRFYRYVNLDKGLDKLLANGAVVLDVRTVSEYNKGHIQGAVNIPLCQLHSHNIPLDKNKVIVTCCSHGLRSIRAVGLLKNRGYKHVYNGGAWEELEVLIKNGR